MKNNEFVKQKINDDEFQSLKGLIHPTALAYNYVVHGNTQITFDLVEKAYHNEIILKPYLREYLRLKQKNMGKSRLLFTDEEMKETMKELEGVYHKLKKEGIVY